MREQKNKRNRILNSAWILFREHGFTKTSMRMIAQAAGVSLGLVTYHFATKENVALEILEEKIRIFKDLLERYISLEEDPILYSASLVRINYKVMSSSAFALFYEDAMRNDLYFRTIPDRKFYPNKGLRSLLIINEKYKLGHSREFLELFGDYLCVSMERTLVLFPKSQEAVGYLPDLVFKTYMTHLDPQFKDFEAYCRKSEALVEKILSEHPELLIPRDLFLESPEEE